MAVPTNIGIALSEATVPDGVFFKAILRSIRDTKFNTLSELIATLKSQGVMMTALVESVSEFEAKPVSSALRAALSDHGVDAEGLRVMRDWLYSEANRLLMVQTGFIIPGELDAPYASEDPNPSDGLLAPVRGEAAPSVTVQNTEGDKPASSGIEAIMDLIARHRLMTSMGAKAKQAFAKAKTEPPAAEPEEVVETSLGYDRNTGQILIDGVPFIPPEEMPRAVRAQIAATLLAPLNTTRRGTMAHIREAMSMADELWKAAGEI